jgi:hypothetical protein
MHEFGLLDAVLICVALLTAQLVAYLLVIAIF